MKMFLYYAWHSFVNQLRKLFKTWVLVFILVCGLIGGLIGFGAASLEEASQTDEIDEIIEIQEEAGLEEMSDSFSLEDEIGIDSIALTELIASGIILIGFAYNLISADKNGSKIFLPADVNLLFSSPMKPQSVLMFRLATQLGTVLAGSIYLLFQLPNLMLNLHLSLWAVLSIFAVWCLTVMIGKLLQVLAYTVTSTYPSTQKYIRTGVYAVTAIFVAGYAFYAKTHSFTYLVAADAFFNSSFARMIPLWGWLKGLLYNAMHGNLYASFLFLLLIIGGMALLVYIIWHIKADFYEDAMAKSEEVAEMMEKASRQSNSIFSLAKKKEREDTVARDGFHYGKGATVFFYKEIYNRFRFGKLHYFTKTSLTYLVVSVLLSLSLRFVLETNVIEPVIIALGVMVFFRTLGNPLNRDVKSHYFLMIPETTWKKLFSSLFAGTVNCFLDLLPAILVSCIVLKTNPLVGLLWIIPVISIDFYATTIGAFLDLSIPSSIGKTFKQMMQLLFIYFGLLPDVAVVAIGYVLHHHMIGVLAMSVVNVYLGMVFFGLSTIFAGSQGGKRIVHEKENADILQAKKNYNMLGIGCVIILAVSTLLQIVVSNYAISTHIPYHQWKWLIWVVTFAPIYLVGVPLGILWMKQVPSFSIPQKKLPVKYFFILPLISLFLLYAGNIAGIAVTSFIKVFVHSSYANPLNAFVSQQSVYLKILFMVILAPVIEEFVFRKILIDRMHVHGGKIAVVTSALMFGLFHGNTSQLFYAFTLGLLFGYVYLKTGRLRYTIALHMLINFLGSVVAPYLAESASNSLMSVPEIQEATAIQIFTPQMILLIIYLLALIALALAGLVLFVKECREMWFAIEENQLPHRETLRIAWCNPGMLVFFAGCLALIVYSFR